MVRSEVQALGGRIETHSQAGQGTQFKIVVPLTTAVTQVVVLRAGPQTFGVPTNLVEAVELRARVGDGDDERLDVVVVAQTLREAGRSGVRGAQGDLDDAALAGVADHPRDGRAGCPEVLGDGLHLHVLEVVHRRRGVRVAAVPQGTQV